MSRTLRWALALLPLLLLSAPLEQAAAQAAVRAGEKVEVQSGGSWQAATVLEVKDGRYKIRYDGWGSSWDEWVLPARLRRPGGGAVGTPGTALPANPGAPAPSGTAGSPPLSAPSPNPLGIDWQTGTPGARDSGAGSQAGAGSGTQGAQGTPGTPGAAAGGLDIEWRTGPQVGGGKEPVRPPTPVAPSPTDDPVPTPPVPPPPTVYPVPPTGGAGGGSEKGGASSGAQAGGSQGGNQTGAQAGGQGGTQPGGQTGGQTSGGPAGGPATGTPGTGTPGSGSAPAVCTTPKDVPSPVSPYPDENDYRGVDPREASWFSSGFQDGFIGRWEQHKTGKIPAGPTYGATTSNAYQNAPQSLRIHPWGYKALGPQARWGLPSGVRAR
jgi:hypothetical protein